MLAADIPSDTPKPCPGHITATPIGLPPALSPRYSHQPCLYSAPYVTMQVLLDSESEGTLILQKIGNYLHAGEVLTLQKTWIFINTAVRT